MLPPPLPPPRPSSGKGWAGSPQDALPAVLPPKKAAKKMGAENGIKEIGGRMTTEFLHPGQDILFNNEYALFSKRINFQRS